MTKHLKKILALLLYSDRNVPNRHCLVTVTGPELVLTTSVLGDPGNACVAGQPRGWCRLPLAYDTRDRLIASTIPTATQTQQPTVLVRDLDYQQINV